LELGAEIRASEVAPAYGARIRFFLYHDWHSPSTKLVDIGVDQFRDRYWTHSPVVEFQRDHEADRR
jgi:hypothetical protein